MDLPKRNNARNARFKTDPIIFDFDSLNVIRFFMTPFEKYIKGRLEKHDMSPSGLVLSFYYAGGSGRFDKLRSAAEEIRKRYYWELKKEKR